MAIDTAMLDALGDNWMIRMDRDGRGHGEFAWAPVGEWTECPKWSKQTRADCESGGLFGQGPGGYGEAIAGTRIVFCETAGMRISVGGTKIKVPSARILYVGADAMAALVHITQSVGGSLDLSGCTLPEGLALPQSVGGWLNLSGCTLPEGLALPQSVGGSINLSGSKMPGCETQKAIRAKLMANRDGKPEAAD